MTNEIKFAMENIEIAGRNILNSDDFNRCRLNTFAALAAILQALESINKRLNELENEAKND